MTESEIILHSLAACLLLVLVFNTPWQRLKVCKAYALWLLLGALLPALGAVVQGGLADSRIAFLLRSPGLNAPAYALGLLGAGGFLLACWGDVAGAWRKMFAVGGGYALQLGLLYLGSTGVPLLYPWHEQYMMLNILPAGMPALNLWLMIMCLWLVFQPRAKRYVAPLGWGVALVLIGFCALQKGIATHAMQRDITSALGNERQRMYIQPKGSIPLRWLAVVYLPDANAVEIWEYALGFKQAVRLHQVAHWRNQAALSALLQQMPAALHALKRLFRNPIGEAVKKNQQWELVLQEAASIQQVVPRSLTFVPKPSNSLGKPQYTLLLQGFD